MQLFDIYVKLKAVTRLWCRRLATGHTWTHIRPAHDSLAVSFLEKEWFIPSPLGRSEVLLNNWDLKKSYNTPSLTIHKAVFARKCSVDVSRSCVKFFFFPSYLWELGCGGWEGLKHMDWTWVLRVSRRLWRHLECYSFLIKLRFLLFSYRARKKNVPRMTCIPGTFKILPLYLIDQQLLYGLWELASVERFGILFWKTVTELNLLASLRLICKRR